jgi:hypothetical protein
MARGLQKSIFSKSPAANQAERLPQEKRERMCVMIRAIRLSIVIVACLAMLGCDKEERDAEKALSEAVNTLTPGFGIESASVGDIALNTPQKSPKQTAKTETKEKKKETPKTEGEKMSDKDKKETPENIEETFDIELVQTDGLQLTELLVAEGIESREPINPNNRFVIDSFERLYAFIKVKNPEKTPDEITVGWAPLQEDIHEQGTVVVSIGEQKKWRTWAFTKTIRKTGKWQVIVRNRDGEIIGRASFEVVEPS